MQKSQIELVALIASVAASALALLVHAQAPWVTSISGFALAVMLFSFVGDSDRSVFQSLAFACACGLGVMLFSDAFYQWMAQNGEIHMAGGRIETEWLPVTWLGATLAIWAIERIRLGRGPATQPTGAVQRGFIPQYVEPPPAPIVSSPQAARVEPVSPPTSPPTAAPMTAAAPVAPVTAMPPVAEPTLPPATPAAPVPVAPPLPQTEIYVSLVGEGLNLMRTVRAEHLGRDFYKIVEQMPAGETWEFGPGQVVRCKKKNLSTGKGLVAFEEAPRAS